MRKQTWIDFAGTTYPSLEEAQKSGAGSSLTDAGADLITHVLVKVAAVDGNFKKVFRSLEAASAFCKSHGFEGDGGVCEHGISRFDGAMIKLEGSSAWRPLTFSLEEKVRKGEI